MRLERGDRRDLAQLGAELGRLALHAVGEVEPGDAIGEAGVVLDQLRQGDLAAGHVALEDDRRATAAGAVDAGRQAGRACAHDGDVVRVGLLRPGQVDADVEAHAR